MLLKVVQLTANTEIALFIFVIISKNKRNPTNLDFRAKPKHTTMVYNFLSATLKTETFVFCSVQRENLSTILNEHVIYSPGILIGHRSRKSQLAFTML